MKASNYILVFISSFLMVGFSSDLYAEEPPTPLFVAIVSSDNSGVQISTTKNSLSGDGVLICPAIEKPCSVYQGDDFSIAKSSDSVEDVATGKSIYTYSLYNSKKHKLQAGTTLAFIFKRNGIGVNDVKFDGRHSFVIRNDKINNIISYCTSSEGVHVISKFDGIHLYYSLGYEVEANCSDEVYK